jgi:hypothetical protein
MQNPASDFVSAVFNHDVVAAAFHKWAKTFEVECLTEVFGNHDAAWEAFAREFLREASADIAEVLGSATGGAQVAAA